MGLTRGIIEMPTANVLGIFAHVDTTLQAIRDLRAKGFSNLTVYTPVPVDEIEAEVEEVRPLSKVRLFTLVGGVTVTLAAFFLAIWASLKWSLVTGGKDPVSMRPFISIAFELTILPRGLSSVLAILILGRLARMRPSPTHDTRFTVDRFGVEV